MAEQETLTDEQPQGTFEPALHTLWTRFVDNGQVNHQAWLTACRNGDFVGTCTCGDFLVPAYPDHIGQRIDYEAHCRTPLTSKVVNGTRDVTGCGRTISAPGGRVARPARTTGRRNS